MLYRLGQFLAAAVFRIAFRTHITGLDRIPRTGPLLIVANHLSFADPLLIGWLCPRPVDFMAMVELFRHPVWGFFVRRLRAFPIDRQQHDHRAVREAVRRLRAGRCVALFPEGGIRPAHQSLQSLKGGAALIAQMAGAPILPVILRDTRQFHDWRRWFRGGVMRVTFGYPFTLLTRDRTQAQAVLREQLAKTVELD